MQQVVHGLIIELVLDLAADPSRAHPALLAQNPQRLRDGILRPTHCLGQLTDADSRDSVQAEQDLQPVGVRQEVEALRPSADVDVFFRGKHFVDRVP